eukprot:3466782-Lingulodinium_polyedra.AAC.1
MIEECNRMIAHLMQSRRDAEERFGQDVHSWIGRWLVARTTAQCNARDILAPRQSDAGAADADRPDPRTRLQLL